MFVISRLVSVVTRTLTVNVLPIRLACWFGPGRQRIDRFARLPFAGTAAVA
jgi:hypothetical protein